jgi:hypothetical protein
MTQFVSNSISRILDIQPSFFPERSAFSVLVAIRTPNYFVDFVVNNIRDRS